MKQQGFGDTRPCFNALTGQVLIPKCQLHHGFQLPLQHNRQPFYAQDEPCIFLILPHFRPKSAGTSPHSSVSHFKTGISEYV